MVDPNRFFNMFYSGALFHTVYIKVHAPILWENMLMKQDVTIFLEGLFVLLP